MIRRAVLGYIVGAGMSVAGIKHHSTKGESAKVVTPKIDTEPLPQYPYLAVFMVAKTGGRGINVITERSDLSKFTDDQIKDMAYRLAEYNGTRLIMSPSFLVNPDGSVTYQAIKGDSGETIEVTF